MRAYSQKMAPGKGGRGKKRGSHVSATDKFDRSVSWPIWEGMDPKAPNIVLVGIQNSTQLNTTQHK
jgi:hypothetical protein